MNIHTIAATNTVRIHIMAEGIYSVGFFSGRSHSANYFVAFPVVQSLESH